ncbi:S24 family peptidase [Parabacteroides sp. AF17-28]|jgi:hypothetical protein|uniref:S24 family peptidase n=1 Tax=Parabacteroides sp. AF17-28 TaxID=2292241 RepID=UPI001F26F095|nr:S24 family peptidase [Parabacteroides sp. AF17-28]
MGIIERFFETIEMAGITPYEIETKLRVKSAQSKISQMKEGKTKGGKEKTLPSDILSAVCISRDDVNADYILTGRGEPLKTPTVTRINHPKGVEKLIPNQDVLLYDISAAANLRTLLGDKTQNIIGKISLPNIPKCDGAVYVKGDSMYPLLKAGDIVAYKEIHNFENVVKGEMYLVSFEMEGDEYLTVKYVNKSDKPGHIKLVSYNPHHDPMDIPVVSINAMALIKVSIRMNTMS